MILLPNQGPRSVLIFGGANDRRRLKQSLLQYFQKSNKIKIKTTEKLLG
jgi:hypothetical protein